MYPDVDINIPFRLLEIIRGFPSAREVTHCGETFEVSPFEIYADCPICSARIKVRSLGGAVEVEGVFDAVFEWIERNQADECVRRRRRQIREDIDRGDDDPMN